MLRGLECFEQALAIDSHYAPAHAGVAMATMLLSFYAYIPAYEGMPRARRSAQRALGIDPAIADAHAALMFVQWCPPRDWEGAERSFRRCVETDPRFVPAYVFHGAHMAFAHGRHEDASAACLRALEIDPLSALVFMAYANACVAGERYQDAVGYAGRGIEIEPQMWIVHRALAAALRMLGRLDESLAAAEQSMALSNRHAWPMQEAIETLLTMRRVDDAHRLAREVLERERAGQPYVSPIAASFAHGVLGHRDESVAWMERAYREHDAIPIWNYWPSTLAGVDGRSVSLLSRVGLKPRPGFGTKA
jgi:tetratricopeptide (TPR) repeat protein